MKLRRVLGWAVHAYTAMGLVMAAGIVDALVGTDPGRFRTAFILMVIACLIDATDGFFARKVRVKEVIPEFDGRRLDDIVDFLNYTFLPLLLLYESDILPPGQSFWLLFPLLASAYGFCQVSVKTDDGFFLGFPSYWNLIAFYLVILEWPRWLAVFLLLFFAAMTFVPSRYLYPTQPGKLNRLSNILGFLWGVALLVLLWLWDPTKPIQPAVKMLAFLSLFYPAFYLAASWYISLRLWRARFARSLKK